MEDFLKAIGAVVMVALLVVFIAACMAYPLMWAWNYAVPRVFQLPRIGALEAFCLNVVAGTLIKSSHSTSSK